MSYRDYMDRIMMLDPHYAIDEKEGQG